MQCVSSFLWGPHSQSGTDSSAEAIKLLYMVLVNKSQILAETKEKPKKKLTCVYNIKGISLFVGD